MRRITQLCTLAVSVLAISAVAAETLSAQASANPRPEIGFRGGLTVYSEDGSSTSVLSFPGGGIFFMSSTVHAMMFVRPTLALEPQVGFLRVGNDGGSSGLFTGAMQIDQFFGDPSAGSVFGLLNVGFTTGFGSGSNDSIYAAGGGVGYRTIVSETLGVRVEGRYRRLFGDEGSGLNEFSVLVGLGTVLGHSAR
ncbi:MAG TPA: hypothetical protein VK912_01865 [Longimicrobiales bacterium]|nr:hypothetical protein [Longimicrobiales bacterium]